MYRIFIPLMSIALCLTVQAENIRIPLGQQGQDQLSIPSRGDSKSLVLDRFGLADEERPPVGHPPITRWDYRYFSVYFESDRVINSVLHHQRNGPTQRETQP